MIWIPKEQCEELCTEAENRSHCTAQAQSSRVVIHRTCHGLVGFYLNDGTKRGGL